MKSKYIPFSLLFVLYSIGGFAQNAVISPDTIGPWKKSLKLSINVNQASFSSNWTAGGVNSIGLNSIFNFKAGYKDGRSNWDNEIDFLYGFVSNEGQGFRKTVDRIFLDTKYGYALSDNWGLFTSLNFLTQFAPGYQYLKDPTGVEQAVHISDFLAPAFITSAWGVEYHPEDYFKVRLSPFAPRITIVSDVERFVTADNPEPYGVIPPDNSRLEWLAFQLLADFNKDIATNLHLNCRYLLFANYETLQLKTIDHRLDVNLTAKVNKFINVGLAGILLYDFDQDSAVQLSQAFSLGFLYTFQNYPEVKK